MFRIIDAGRAPETIARFTRLAAIRNTARSFPGSLRAAASGMQPYANFCVFIGRPAFPAQTENILLRVGLSRPGRAFAQYISHVAKSAFSIDYPTDWLSPAARSVTRGLKNSHGLSFRFQNFMFASGLLHLLKSAPLLPSSDRRHFFRSCPAPSTVRNAPITFRRGLGRTSGLFAASIQGYRWCPGDSRLAASFGEISLAGKHPFRLYSSSPMFVRRTN